MNNSIVDDEIIDSMKLTDKLDESWLQVNTCRVYTGHIVDMEEFLIPSMGLINDAKCMFESLIAWRLGMTMYGKYNIVQCLRQAALDYINPAIEELENLLCALRDAGEDEDCFVQCVSF